MADSYQGVGDFNYDGNTDILLRHTSGVVVVWLINGTSIIGGSSTNQHAALDWQIHATGDFDGDGKYDILFRCRVGATTCTPGKLMIWLLYCSTGPRGICTVLPGSGVVNDPALPGEPVLSNDQQIVETGVFNNDDNNANRRSGILLHNTTNGQLLAWNMVGTKVNSKFAFTGAVVPVLPPLQVQGLNAN